jgi:hypothetical protein
MYPHFKGHDRRSGVTAGHVSSSATSVGMDQPNGSIDDDHDDHDAHDDDSSGGGAGDEDHARSLAQLYNCIEAQVLDTQDSTLALGTVRLL